MDTRKVIINGYTKEGLPIWRYETAEEILISELEKNIKANKESWVETTKFVIPEQKEEYKALEKDAKAEEAEQEIKTK